MIEAPENVSQKKKKSPNTAVYFAENSGLGIRTRLVLLIVVATMIAIGLFGSYAAKEREDTMFDAEKERAAAFLESLSLPCAISVATKTFESLDNFMSESVRNTSPNTRLLSLSMIGHNGILIMDAGSEEENSQSRLGREIFSKAQREAFTNAAFKAAQPIWIKKSPRQGSTVLMMSMPAVSGLRWGTLIASFDLSTYDERITRLRFYGLVTNLALIIGLVLVLFVGVSRLVVKPLRELSESMERLQRGELDTRVTGHMGGEMKALALGFNAMAGEIESHTKNLEQKVEARSQEVRIKAQELEQVNTQLQDAVNTLETLVRTDELTGIFNRRHLTEVLQTETRRSVRSNRPLTVAMLDVDRFKTLNDNHGHAAGDHVLRSVAKLLQDKLRSTDMIARFGGEEFVVLFFDTPKDAAHTVAEGLREIIAKTSFDTHSTNLEHGVTVSIGLASCPADATDASALLEKADEAMYAAKNAGRNRVVLWSGSNES